jgi:hypothetical protein
MEDRIVGRMSCECGQIFELIETDVLSGIHELEAHLAAHRGPDESWYPLGVTTYESNP